MTSVEDDARWGDRRLTVFADPWAPEEKHRFLVVQQLTRGPVAISASFGTGDFAGDRARLALEAWKRLVKVRIRRPDTEWAGSFPAPDLAVGVSDVAVGTADDAG